MVAPPKPRGSSLSLRPFYATVFILSCLTAYSIVARRLSPGSLDPVSTQHAQDGLPLTRRSASQDCREVHHAVDQCAFVKEWCRDDEAGLFSYLTLYYCGLGHVQGIAFLILVCWLGLLFTTIGIAASDFFSVNLSTIASILGLSESLAGVTFLAFGNGSPDVFSTFAAMGSNSASMAVGELLGAASFITAVVAGSMALAREFQVGRRAYVRDICFFIVAVIFTTAFLADGHLHLWECIAMIAYYVFYVVVVVGWHWWVSRRKRRLARDAAARSHVYGAVGHANDELSPEPYRDDPNEEDTTVGSNGASPADISTLEAGPRIEIEGEEADLDGKSSSNEEEDEDRGRQLAAEMASSMRVLRPRGGRRNTTITPIRPSLVGALEFRSALAQLQKESNHRLRNMHGHGRGHGRGHARAYSDYHVEGIHSDTATAVGVPASRRYPASFGPGESTGRNRALSTNDIPPFSFLPPPAQDINAGPSGASTPGAPSNTRTRSPSSAYKIGGNLAPPPVEPGAPRKDVAEAESPKPPGSPSLSRLVMPTAQDGSGQSSPTTPFPNFTDSPLLLSPNFQAESTEYFPPAPTHVGSPLPPFPAPEAKPVKWWPYSVLPPPHVLTAVLFPTLQDWKEKTHWDKFVSAISVPSILLLVITLPVVETEAPDDVSDETIVHRPSHGQPGNIPAPVSVEEDAEIQPETEWQRYRRRARSRSQTRRSSLLQHPSPALVAVDSSGTTTPILAATVPDAQTSQPSKTSNTIPSAALSLASDAGAGNDDNAVWNRWLVALQVFTGPMFSVIIVWANMSEDLNEPVKVLLRLLLGSVVASITMLGVLLLTTSPDRRPKYHFLLCFLGFIISVAWISTIAGEVVGVLKAFGVILGISDALLGLTIFAAGNSLGDLVANITVARLGYPVMALSACFGGPMLNILLGIGLGGVWMMVQAANHRQKKHPDRPYKYKPYKIKIDATLMISAVALLITLLVLLIVVPMNKWILSRKIGYGLIGLWTVGTIVNIVVEVTGVWAEI